MLNEIVTNDVENYIKELEGEAIKSIDLKKVLIKD